MEKKDKKILILISGAFLAVIVFMVFLALNSVNNIMDNTARVIGSEPWADEIDEPKLGDTRGNADGCAIWNTSQTVDRIVVQNPNDACSGYNSCSIQGCSPSGQPGYYSCAIDYEKRISCRQYHYTSCNAGYYLNSNAYCEENKVSVSCTMMADNKFECTASVTHKKDGKSFGWSISGAMNYSVTESFNDGEMFIEHIIIDPRVGEVSVLVTYDGRSKSTSFVVEASGSAEGETTCSGGYYYDNTADDCLECNKGYYCPGGDKNPSQKECPKGTYSDEVGASSCKSCPVGYTTNGKNSKDVTDCKVCDTDAGYENTNGKCVLKCTDKQHFYNGQCYDNDKCSIEKIETDSKVVSIHSNGASDDNSYYTVAVSVSGDGCPGFVVNNSTNNGTIYQNSSVNITSTKQSYTFRVYPIKPCTSSTATSKLNLNGNTKSTTVNVIKKDWTSQTSCYRPTGTVYTSSTDADKDGVNVYYTGKNADTTNCKDGYTTKWTRGGCSPSNPGTSGYACYSNGTNYTWATSAPSGYTKVTSILSESLCKPETPACYTNGTLYKWGKYASVSGWVLVSSITDETKCDNPTSGYACYKNSNDEYLWTNEEPPEGYEAVTSITTALACAKEEEPACYLYNGDLYWGKYSKNSGYVLVDTIMEKGECTKVSACYIDKNNKYHWGDYSLDNDYTLVPDADRAACGDIPVPKTAASRNTIIYVAMVCMIGAGIWFIYYSNKLKKND